MSESVEFKVKFKPDTSEINRAFADIGRKGKEQKKQNVSVGGGTKSSPTTRPLPASKHPSNNNRTNNTRGFIDKSRSASTSGAQAAQQTQAEYGQFARGGFYEAVQGKMDSAKNIKNTWDDWGNKKKSDKEGGQGNGSNSSQQGKGALSAGQKSEFKESIFKNVKVEKVDLKSAKGMGGFSFNSGGGKGGGGISSNAGGGGSKAGNLAGDSGKSLPIMGIGLIIAGAVAKAASSFGEAHISAMMSQAGSYGATGAYVGGGGGLFDNADVAQANVARAKVSGESIYGKGNQIGYSEMQFAASQGRGVSEIAETMAKLRKESSQGLNFYRGAANQAGFQNLRQSEFLTKMGSISESQRSQGYSGNMDSFMGTVAGMKLGGANQDPNRKISIAESFKNNAAKGIFGGGIMGMFAFKEAMEQNDGDVLKSMIAGEGKDGAKLAQMGLQNAGLSDLALAVIGKQSGDWSATEAAGMRGSDPNKAITADNSAIKAGEMETRRLENEKNLKFANSNISGDIAKTMQQAAGKMLDAMGKIDAVYAKMEEATQAIIAGATSSAAVTVEFLSQLNGESIMQAIDTFIPGGPMITALDKIGGMGSK